MSKRKRASDADQDDAATATDFRRQRQIAATFADSAKQLARAFKAGKGFERQKLGRRKKTAVAVKDEKDVARIDAEIAALKTLDNTVAAEHYLAKSLLKIKAVATSPNLPPDLQKPKPLPSDTPSLNVNARLCSSNPVKEAFPTAIAAVKREFGIKEDLKAPVKKKRTRAKDYEDASRARSMSVSSADDEGGRVAQLRKVRARDSDDESELQHDPEDSEDDLQHYRGRLASSDDEDLDGVSDIEDLERRLMAEGISQIARAPKAKKHNHAADFSLSDMSKDESESEEEQRPKKAAAPKKSSFIPSLTLGGYISGSGSDIESDVDIAPRKNNRRGQRARQKIWEQKYGSRAVHLKNEQRTQGWDPKRGAVDSDRGGKFGKNKGNGANSMALGRDRRVPGDRGKATTAEMKQKPRKDDSGPLHPSWEAAKRAKEKKAAPVAFQGKKISFD